MTVSDDMSELTGKQRRALRAMGTRLAVCGAVGKAGLTDAVVASIDGLLADNELVKVRLAGAAGAQRKEISQQLAGATGSCCVGIVGHPVMLYRPNEDLAPERRVAI